MGAKTNVACLFLLNHKLTSLCRKKYAHIFKSQLVTSSLKVFVFLAVACLWSDAMRNMKGSESTDGVGLETKQ